MANSFIQDKQIGDLLRPNMALSLAKGGRLAFSFVWSLSLAYDVLFQPRLGHSWYLYKIVMLTNLNFVLVTAFSVLSAFTEFIPLQKFLRPKLDYVFLTAVFPVSFVTCALFWGLFAIEPELVMPSWVAQLIPSWLNHVTHTFPIVYILFESFVSQRNRVSNRNCLRTALLLVGVYFIIIFVVKWNDGYWLYPLLELFSFHHFIATYFVAAGGFYLLIQLSQLFNRQQCKIPKKNE